MNKTENMNGESINLLSIFAMLYKHVIAVVRKRKKAKKNLLQFDIAHNGPDVCVYKSISKVKKQTNE